MRQFAVFMFCFIFFGCNFNANVTYENEKAEKENAESIAGMFYLYISRNEFDSVLDLFSGSFYEVSSKSDLKEFLIDKRKKLGDFKDYTLKNWKTRRVEGTNAVTEYLLTYQVKYSKNQVIEKVTLIKEKDKIKICGYDVSKPVKTN